MTLKEDKKTITILRVLSVFAFAFFLFMVVRFIDQSFWRDEAVAALTAQRSPGEIIRIMVQDNNPPLFRLLLSVVYRLFGKSEIALRSISVLSVIGTGVILRKLIKNKIGKELATISFFLMPLTYIYGTEARAYTFFMFLGMLSYFFMLKLHKEKSLQNHLLFALSSTLMLYSFTTSIFVFAGIFLAFLYLENEKSFSIKELIKTLKMKWRDIIPALAPLILFLPWIAVIFKQAQNLRSGNYWLSFHPSISLIQSAAGLFTSIVFYYPPEASFFVSHSTIAGLAVVIITVSTLTTLVLIKSNKLIKNNNAAKVILLATPLVLAYLVSFYQPVLHARYLLILSPITLAILYRRLPNGANNIKVLACLLLAVLNPTVAGILYPQAQIKPGYKELAAKIEEFDTGNTLIVTDNEFPYFSCEWYLERCYILKDYDSFYKPIGIALLDPERTINEEEASEYDQIAIIYWDKDYPPTYEFLDEYNLTESYQDPSSGISVDFYIK